ncbi:hypothetical protein Q8F55_003342 [Vanrija albida]|uniref:CFEM domain-containing protein n=1 Tax=Vanrija albida TaxID=181172 RepID=A0ABR3Q3N8_9TREE
MKLSILLAAAIASTANAGWVSYDWGRPVTEAGWFGPNPPPGAKTVAAYPPPVESKPPVLAVSAPPASSAAPAPTSQPPASAAPSSAAPSPKPSAPPVDPNIPHSSNGTIPDLSKLTTCALQCVLDGIPAAGCHSPLDDACMCYGDNFLNIVTKCITAKCKPEEALPALDLGIKLCPKLPLPNLSTLDICAGKCIVSQLGPAGCKGPLDFGCICSAGYIDKVSPCLLNACDNDKVTAALNYLPNICPSLPLPDLKPLQTCARDCVINTIKGEGCNSPLNTGCICTEPFTNKATQCIFGACPSSAVPAVLKLETNLCPNLRLPNLDGLTPCAVDCVVKGIQSQKCAGPLDNNCICSLAFPLNVAGCIIGKCGFGDLGPAINLQFGQCKPGGLLSAKCQASGIFKLLQPACWFSGFKNNAVVQRRGTPDAMVMRHLFEQARRGQIAGL